MKKLAVLICVAMLVLTFSGCGMWRENAPLEDVIPWGTWESENPSIVLFVNSDYRIGSISYFTYPALYRSEDGEMKVFVTFNTRGGMIGSFRPHTMEIFYRDGRFNVSLWFGVTRDTRDAFQIVDGRLHFFIPTEPTNPQREEALIFDRIEWYPPINLDDWLEILQNANDTVMDEEIAPSTSEQSEAHESGEWVSNAEYEKPSESENITSQESGRIDIQDLIELGYDELIEMFGEPIDEVDTMNLRVYFSNGLIVEVGASAAIVFSQADYLHDFHFSGIDGTSTYDDVVTLFGEPYNIRDESSFGAVKSYAYQVHEWHFVRFFIDNDGNVVAIAFFTLA